MTIFQSFDVFNLSLVPDHRSFLSFCFVAFCSARWAKECAWRESDRGEGDLTFAHCFLFRRADRSLNETICRRNRRSICFAFPLTISINNVAIRIPSWIVAQPRQLAKCSIKSSILDPHLSSCPRICRLRLHHLQPSLPIVDDK